MPVSIQATASAAGASCCVARNPAPAQQSAAQRLQRRRPEAVVEPSRIDREDGAGHGTRRHDGTHPGRTHAMRDRLEDERELQAPRRKAEQVPLREKAPKGCAKSANPWRVRLSVPKEGTRPARTIETPVAEAFRDRTIVTSSYAPNGALFVKNPMRERETMHDAQA